MLKNSSNEIGGFLKFLLQSDGVIFYKGKSVEVFDILIFRKISWRPWAVSFKVSFMGTMTVSEILAAVSIIL